MSDMKKPDRDGIAEILASGRAPGFFVRGQESKTLEVPLPPGRDPVAQKRAELKIIKQREAIAKMARKQSRSSLKKGLRQTSSVPMDVEIALRERYGSAYQGEEKAKIQKRHGFSFED